MYWSISLMKPMKEGDKLVIYSPDILTENGVFEVGSNGSCVITKLNDNLLVLDPISLGVIEQLGKYAKAKNITISPCSEYICFMNGNPPSSLTIITLGTKAIQKISTNYNFLIEQVFWSPDSKFIAYSSELSVYLGVWKVGYDQVIIEGPCCDDFNIPLAEFSPNVVYFSLIKNGVLISYSTETWESHSRIKCITNPTGLIYIDNCVVAVWNGGGEFIVYCLTGEKLFYRKLLLTSRIKSAKLCNERRTLILATFDDKVEVYDITSWNLLYYFEYPLKIKEQMGTISWIEPISNLTFNINKNYSDIVFNKNLTLVLKPVKNICDEFKLKTNNKFLIEFSKKNQFLATYSPSYPQTIWIRCFTTGRITDVVSLCDNSLQVIKWHPDKYVLGIVTLDSIVFWTEKKVFAVYSKNLITSFNWIPSKLIMCSVATSSGGVLIYVENG